jgi:hypothetical protein
MTLLQDQVADYAERFGKRLSLPEYRQIELYARKRRVLFDEDGAAPAPIPGLLGLTTAFALLNDFLEAADPSLEGKAGWERYLALPRKTTTDKLVAEVFRILRLVRTTIVHAAGHIEVSDGLVKLFCTYNRCALTLNITPLGLDLLRSFVVYYLDSLAQPYGEAYVEAALTAYFTDIVTEIKSFADEDRVLFQFRRKFATFNRTQRLDCDTPRFSIEAETVSFDIGASYANGARYPIDIFVVIDEQLYIIPVEALTDFALPVAELAAWKARTSGPHLPARFALRFGREIQVVGLPMT